VDAGTDVNAKDKYGRTPLDEAARSHKEVVELLIENGADVNAKDKKGFTPLDEAILFKQTEIPDLLRKHGGKTEKELEVATRPSRQQRSESSNNSDKEKALELLLGTNSTITEKDEALLSAAKKGKLDEVKSLLAEGVDVDCSDAFSCTGLFWASANNHKSIVEFLIEKGANLNAGAGVGGTPLARAAYEGHVEVVELLLTKGADVNAKDVSGGSPLDSADESVVDLLRKHGGKTKEELEVAGKAIKPVAEAEPEPAAAKASYISIHEAAEAGNIESVKQAIADGADVNAKNEDGVTPLSSAAYFGHKKVVELLIAKDADVNAKDNLGDTPIDWAVAWDEPEIADLLRKHGGKTGEELKAEGK
jgi:ankyrin repeat protein